MKDLLNRLTGLIALVSAIGFTSAFFIWDEGTAEFLLIISPILSLLLIPAMHRILKIHRPKASFATMMTGISAIGLFVIAYLIDRRSEDLVLIGSLGLISLVLVGIWLITVNLLAIEAKIVPRALGFIGVGAGISWIIVMTAMMLSTINGFQINHNDFFGLVYGTALMGLLFGYALWSLGTGLYFVSGKVSRKLKLS